MCKTCGCDSDEITLTNMETGRHIGLEAPIGPYEHVHEDGTRHSHSHDHHEHNHHHDHGHDRQNGAVSVIELNSRILAKNDAAAGRNRVWLGHRGILALNLMSAPGAGKTTLLERTIAGLKDRHAVSVLEGDQATDHDGARMRNAGAPAVQINTGQGCHLDAEMLTRGIAELAPPPGSVLFIENVGNLVCPALFDLGENRRIALLSVTEGEDKPLKYPHMFRAADLMLLNKIDLLPHLRFDVERAIAFAQQVNPRIEILRISAETGDGLPEWFSWIDSAVAENSAGAVA